MLSRHQEMCDRALLKLREPPGWRRAGGDCLCPECGETYYEHPQAVPFYWLTVLCTGDYVKL